MPMPEFLAKKGINVITDNVPDGHQVRAPAGALLALFEDEILAVATTRSRAVPIPHSETARCEADAQAFEDALATLERMAATSGGSA